MKKILSIIVIFLIIYIAGTLIGGMDDNKKADAWTQSGSLTKDEKIYIATCIKNSDYEDVDYKQCTYELIDETKYVVVVRVHNKDGRSECFTVSKDTGRVTFNPTYN
jgi:hypothetical protein